MRVCATIGEDLGRVAARVSADGHTADKTRSVELSWLVDDIPMYGMLTVPDGAALPSLVMVAGERAYRSGVEPPCPVTTVVAA